MATHSESIDTMPSSSITGRTALSESLPEKPQFQVTQAHTRPLHFIVSYSSEDNHTQDTLKITNRLHAYYSARSRGVDPPRVCDERLPYDESHLLWTPRFEKEVIRDLMDKDHKAPTNKKYSPALSSESFINYVGASSTIGEYTLPTLVHHTTCDVKDNLYVLGGYVTLHKNYKTFDIDTSNFILRQGVRLPLPLNADLLNHLLLIPNDNLYVVSSVTNRVTKPRITGDIPPPLLSMSASQITKRHIFYYGGFQIVDHVTQRGQSFIIDKEVILNNDGYLLDTITHKFRKFELTAHPNMVTRCPITIPRFGHTSTSINSNTITPATIYIMGGYCRDSEDPEKFEAIQDLWKLELSISYEGDNDYLEFGDIVLATPVAAIGSPPMARAFHAADVHKNHIVYHGGTNGTKIFGDTWMFDINEETWTELKTTFEGKQAQMKTVAHQAIILDRFLAPLVGSAPCDLGVDTELEENEVHDISMLYRSRERAEIYGANSLYYVQFCLDLRSKRWIEQRVYHDYDIPVRGKEDELSYTGMVGGTVTQSNSRIIIIGGQLTAGPDLNDLGRSHVLNSGLGSIEVPLGCFVDELKTIH